MLSFLPKRISSFTTVQEGNWILHTFLFSPSTVNYLAFSVTVLSNISVTPQLQHLPHTHNKPVNKVTMRPQGKKTPW